MNNPGNGPRRHARIAAALWCASAVAAPATACPRWDLSGPVAIHQANAIRVVGDLAQSDESLTGSLRYWSTALAPDAQVRVGGALDGGSVSGSEVRFRVRWRADWQTSTKSPWDWVGFEQYAIPHIWEETGIYEGSISPDGRVEGISYNESTPTQRVNWSLRDPVTCRPAAPAAAPREAIRAGMDDATDRPGGDYRRFELSGRDPEACQLACAGAEARCRAWTYVRPGVQGPSAVCYLKSTITRPVPDACCISGMPPGRTSPEALRDRPHALPRVAPASP